MVHHLGCIRLVLSGWVDKAARMTDSVAWVLTFVYRHAAADIPSFIALVFAVRFCGLEVEFWIPKFLQNGVKDL